MLRKRIAIDLGTANSLVLVEDKGVVLNVPTVVAYSRSLKKVIAIGDVLKQKLVFRTGIFRFGNAGIAAVLEHQQIVVFSGFVDSSRNAALALCRNWKDRC